MPRLLAPRNIILVGDAAGVCNGLNGEGIRLNGENGVAACNADQDSTHVISLSRQHTEIELNGSTASYPEFINMRLA